MKRAANAALLLFLAVLMVNAAAASEDKKTFLESWGLHGKVRKVVVIEALMVEREGKYVEVDHLTTMERLFDEGGHLLEQTLRFRHSSSEFAQWTEKHRLNEYGDRIETRFLNADNGTLLRRVEYLYDERGFNTEQIRYGPDGEIAGTEKREIDDQGNIILSTFFDKNGRPGIRTMNEYDEQGNCLETTQLDAKGSLIFKMVSEYDVQGNRTLEKYLNPDGSPKNGTTWKYDDHGVLTEMTEYAGFTWVRCYRRYTYDGAGRMIMEVTHNPDHSIYGRTTYLYDVQGNEIREVVFVLKQEGEKETYIPTKRTTRQITYRDNSPEQKPD